MSPLSNDSGQRCPRCGALGRAGGDWCTLCYTDLRPKPAVEPEAVAPDGAVSPAVEELAEVYVPPVVVAQQPRGRHARRDPDPAETEPVAAADATGATAPSTTTAPNAANDPDRPGLDEEEADAMIALLAAQSGPNPLTGLGSQLDSVAAKTVVMAGGVVVVSLVLFALMALVGSLL